MKRGPKLPPSKRYILVVNRRTREELERHEVVGKDEAERTFNRLRGNRDKAFDIVDTAGKLP